MSTTINGTDNSAAAPALVGSDTDTGVFFPAANTTAFSNGGTETMRIDSAGNVGIGTSSPSTQLELSSATPVITVNQNTINSDTGIKFKYSGNTVFGQVTGNASTGEMKFISGQSGQNGYYQTFATNGTERMRIDTSGNLLVGTTSATSGSRFSLVSSNNTTATYNCLFKNSSGTIVFAIDDGGNFYSGAASASPYNNTTASVANLVVQSGGLLQRSTSSIKYKTNVEDATHGLAEVLKLRPVTYKGKNDGDTVFGGLIAEEVDKAGLKEFVTYAEDGSPDALAYGNMVSLCIKAIQELKAELDEAKAEIALLKAK